MAHVAWKRAPVSAPPVGITVSTDPDGIVVASGADRDALTAWQLALLRAGELALDDLAGTGDGAREVPGQVISGAKAKALADLEAVDASKATVTQLRTAIAAVKAAGG